MPTATIICRLRGGGSHDVRMYCSCACIMWDSMSIELDIDIAHSQLSYPDTLTRP